MTAAETRRAAPALPRRLGRPARRAAMPAGCWSVVVARHAGLQHAGRAAGTLWRRDPRPLGLGHDAADRALGDGRAGRLRSRRAAGSGGAWTRYRMAARGLLVGHRRLLGCDLRRPDGHRRRCSSLGAVGIGLGGGLFAVATLTAAMTLPERGLAGRGPRAWRLGRGAGHGGRACHRLRRLPARRRRPSGRWRAASARRCTRRRPATPSSTTSKSDCSS